MISFEEICDNLNIDWKSQEQEFKDGPWHDFTAALKITAIRTWSYKEAFLAWLMVMKFKPKAVLELGSQHGHSGLVWLDAVKKIDGLFIALELGKDPRNNYPDPSIGTMKFLPDDNDNIIKIWGEAEEELPGLLSKYPIDFVFHDCAHTWDHVENCVTTINNFNLQIIQTCHDCAEGKWEPEKKTKYGVIWAERPVFDKYFLSNSDYYYDVLEDKHGFGFAVPKDKQ